MFTKQHLNGLNIKFGPKKRNIDKATLLQAFEKVKFCVFLGAIILHLKGTGPG